MNSYEKFIQIPKWKSVNILHLPMPPAFIILHNILGISLSRFFPICIPSPFSTHHLVYLKKTCSFSFSTTWPNCLIWPALSSIKSLSVVDRWRMDQRASRWKDQWQNGSIGKWRWPLMEKGNEGRKEAEEEETANWTSCRDKKVHSLSWDSLNPFL